MSTDSSLGTLGVNIAAYAGQFMAELTRAENGMTKFQRGISKTLTKAGLDTIGLGNAARAMSNELQYVWNNIEKIPGIDPTTIASVKEMKTEVEAFQQGIHRLVAGGMGLFAQFGKSIGLVAGGIAQAFKMTSLQDLFINPTMMAANFVVALGAVDAALQADFDSAVMAAQAQDRLAAATASTTEAKKEAAALLALISKQNKDFAQSEAELLRQMMAAGESIRRDVLTPQEEWAEQLVKLDGLLKAAAISQETFNRAMRTADMKLEIDTTSKPPAADQLEKHKADFNNVRSAAAEFESEMNMMWTNVSYHAADAFATMVLDGENAFKELPKMAARAAIGIVARLAIINPLMNMLFGGLSGFQTLPAFFGSGSGAAPAGARAAGGPVSGGSSYLVGEKGPELFTPASSGSIIPNDKLGGGRERGGGHTFNIDARGADRTGLSRLESMIRSLDGTIEMRAISAVSDHRRRGAYG